MKLFNGMRQVAEHKQWKLDPPDPGALDTTAFQHVHLTGSEDGIPIHLDAHASVYRFTTTASIEPSIPWTFVITHQGLGGDLANLIGFQDIEVGDAEFDKRFRIVSKEIDKTKALLTPDVRTQLKKLDDAAKGFGASFEVTDHAVSFSRSSLASITSVTYADTEEAVLKDVPAVLGVVRALKEAGRTYR